MARSFDAADKFAVERTEDMDPFHTLAPGTGTRSGVMKAHVTVWEQGDKPHESQPTLREFLAKNVDPTTDVLTFTAHTGVRLSMDPTPLRELPAEYLDRRVSPGCTFVTDEARERARGST